MSDELVKHDRAKAGALETRDFKMIRELCETDIEEVALYVSKALSTEFEKVGEKKYTFDKSKKDIELGFNKGWIQLVYENESENNGFISAIIEEGEGHIITLVVREDQKRRGIGSLLLSEVIKRFKEKGVNKVNLNIHYKNEEASTFFKKFGFTERTIEFSKDL